MRKHQLTEVQRWLLARMAEGWRLTKSPGGVSAKIELAGEVLEVAPRVTSSLWKHGFIRPPAMPAGTWTLTPKGRESAAGFTAPPPVHADEEVTT